MNVLDTILDMIEELALKRDGVSEGYGPTKRVRELLKDDQEKWDAITALEREFQITLHVDVADHFFPHTGMPSDAARNYTIADIAKVIETLQADPKTKPADLIKAIDGSKPVAVKGRRRTAKKKWDGAVIDVLGAGPRREMFSLRRSQYSANLAT